MVDVDALNIEIIAIEDELARLEVSNQRRAQLATLHSRLARAHAILARGLPHVTGARHLNKALVQA
jgi:hypothetical protein